MVIVTSEVLERLEREGKLPKGAGRPLARVGVGVAVNERAADPDISTADAFGARCSRRVRSCISTRRSAPAASTSLQCWNAWASRSR